MSPLPRHLIVIGYSIVLQSGRMDCSSSYHLSVQKKRA